jgi:hypothetical protein
LVISSRPDGKSGWLSLQDLMASPAAFLVDANLLVALGTSPEPAPFDFLLSWPQGHDENSSQE